ncbi:serine/threonine-protein kinase [Streptomyces sp. NBC_00338]|uniref:serine/threonine-protein kinase n=1 Tax=Streptomyces sp. NBC_00338 TaxID=2975715 RepID=UPI002254D36B|nr:serine/threonine-protein kinase [Streptomyces sp. NBC_00338]MCX5141303.1 serine/threonine-protein kinase [Streptomyces sp. NBC_00338]
MSGPEPYAVASVPPGYRVGPWIVEEPLGAGAFGHVYAARHEDGAAELPRAALKFLPTGTRTPRQLHHLRELAEREVDLLSRLRSPRLIRMHDTLTVDDPAHPELDGATVLVLEEARGSLDALLAADRPPRQGPRLLVQICEGLHQLHEAGWVHGDLKPGNVLLMEDGTARLGDFNMAAELEGTHAYSPGFATADYTPPELLWSEVGERGMQIRRTTDVWAFGVLAHVVLTGSFPLPGGTPTARRDAAVRYARGEEELRLSSELPTVWREIVADCLSRTHEERAPYDAASLLRRTSEAAAGRPPRRRRARRPLLAAAAGVLVLAVAGLGVRTLLTDDPAPRPEARTGAGAGAGADARAGRSPGPTGTATGYDRCAPGSVCFFSAADGGGQMCAWSGDDSDWTDGQHDCSWAIAGTPGSIYNNGVADPKGFVDVAYFAEAGLRRRIGCVERGQRRNLAPGRFVHSHTWAKTCTP